MQLLLLLGYLLQRSCWLVYATTTALQDHAASVHQLMLQLTLLLLLQRPLGVCVGRVHAIILDRGVVWRLLDCHSGMVMRSNQETLREFWRQLNAICHAFPKSMAVYL